MKDLKLMERKQKSSSSSDTSIQLKRERKKTKKYFVVNISAVFTFFRSSYNKILQSIMVVEWTKWVSEREIRRERTVNMGKKWLKQAHSSCCGGCFVAAVVIATNYHFNIHAKGETINDEILYEYHKDFLHAMRIE